MTDVPQLEPEFPDTVTWTGVPAPLHVTTYTELVRHPRARCVTCGLRRILYSLVTTGDPASLGTVESARLCARDAGILR